LGTIRTEENALWSFAPHDISVILSLAGGPLPNQVRCEGGAYLSKGIADTTLTTMHFENDIFAHIYVSWLHPFKEQKLVVTGSQGMAVFDDTLPWEQKLQFFKQPVTWKEGSIPQANKAVGESIQVPLGEPLKEECLHFIQSCNDRSTPRTNAAEGIRVLKVLSSAQHSLENRGEITLLEQTPNPSSFFAHTTAEIHPNAAIGKGTKIWHFSHVMDGAVIGENCNIGQNVVISPGVQLGENVKVQNNVSVYTGVVCEEDVFLGPSMVFTNVINPRSAVNRKNEYKITHVRKGATIGANATIVCGNELGEYCFIGAGAVVTKSVKPYALVIGNPAKQTGWISAHGEKLDLPLSTTQGSTEEATCPTSGERYILSHNTVKKA
jgi:UDP-2-acetamido-3-amino-2,3-dideoxy-glucuronate N-acetyltransferase